MRDRKELYEHQWYNKQCLHTCLSRDPGGVEAELQRWEGRVTALLKTMVEAGTVPKDSLFYLCGNCDMIYEVYDIISEAGIEPNQIFAEVYF